jgi:hypothetical protein
MGAWIASMRGLDLIVWGISWDLVDYSAGRSWTFITEGMFDEACNHQNGLAGAGATAGHRDGEERPITSTELRAYASCAGP